MSCWLLTAPERCRFCASWQGWEVAALDGGWRAWGEQTVGSAVGGVPVEAAVGTLVQGARRDVGEDNTDGGSWGQRWPLK